MKDKILISNNSHTTYTGTPALRRSQPDHLYKPNIDCYRQNRNDNRTHKFLFLILLLASISVSTYGQNIPPSFTRVLYSFTVDEGLSSGTVLINQTDQVLLLNLFLVTT